MLNTTLEIDAMITGINYEPYLCRSLKTYSLADFAKALRSDASFILEKNRNNKVALSWWVSAKRTRSYPYARVYDTLNFSGKKVTIIPVIKDEGSDGDRDFLQWDTLSLMSLLGVYVIVSYYGDATKNEDYRNKITEQKYDVNYITKQLQNLCSYQSDALHWNLEQAEMVPDLGKKAIESYQKISERLKVKMHSKDSALRKIQKIKEGKDAFMKISRTLAKKAQNRESMTTQPKEQLNGSKGKITIKNYLGGFYYFTSDEIEIYGNNIRLIEGKHSKNNELPSLDDIKDGLVKMILFSNLKNVKISSKHYRTVAQLKLTSEREFNENNLNESQKNVLKLLIEEAKTNNFEVRINEQMLWLK